MKTLILSIALLGALAPFAVAQPPANIAAEYHIVTAPVATLTKPVAQTAPTAAQRLAAEQVVFGQMKEQAQEIEYQSEVMESLFGAQPYFTGEVAAAGTILDVVSDFKLTSWASDDIQDVIDTIAYYRLEVYVYQTFPGSSSAYYSGEVAVYDDFFDLYSSYTPNPYGITGGAY